MKSWHLSSLTQVHRPSSWRWSFKLWLSFFFLSRRPAQYVAYLPLGAPAGNLERQARCLSLTQDTAGPIVVDMGKEKVVKTMTILPGAGLGRLDIFLKHILVTSSHQTTNKLVQAQLKQFILDPLSAFVFNRGKRILDNYRGAFCKKKRK